ncbi:MAG TPA: hypothetical protein VGY31_09125 [Terriglobia bacterium]|nr:hypothetical protein [Terriglobia bacterium]
MNSPKDQTAEFDLPTQLTTQLKSLLTNPLVFLACVSAFSYFVALVFEVFYCKYFGIPYFI